MPPYEISYYVGTDIQANRSLHIFSDVRGNAPHPSDFYARFNFSWNENGLLFHAWIEDDTIYENPDRFWNGDGLELFLNGGPGSPDIVQFSVRPGLENNDSLAEVKIYDHRRNPALLQIPVRSCFTSEKTQNGYLIRGCIGGEFLGIDSLKAGSSLGIQLYLNDADHPNDSTRISLPWFPVRESYRNPYAFRPVILTGDTVFRTEPYPEVRAYIRDNDSLHVCVYSHSGPELNGLSIRAGKFEVPLCPEKTEQGSRSGSWSFPGREFDPVKDAVLIGTKDSMNVVLDYCLIHREYVDTEKPNRFEDEIRLFEIINHFEPAKENKILFTGSSTIRRWYSLEADLGDSNILNLGFGGSTMEDLNYYRERIIFPYRPSKIFIYEGDNDIARGSNPRNFISECENFILACEEHLPDTRLYFISIKPSPARLRNWSEMKRANLMLEKLCDQFENSDFIDISPALMNESAEPISEYYESDRLHLNNEGYNALVKILIPYLIH